MLVVIRSPPGLVEPQEQLTRGQQDYSGVVEAWREYSAQATAKMR